MDWLPFFDQHNIFYRTSGPNVAKDHAVIKCPFCGENDPSEHMGIELVGRNRWACWRNPTHRGVRPHRLIMRLLGCSFEAADGYVAGGKLLDRFEMLAQALIKPKQAKTPDRSLKLLSSFRQMKPTGSGKRYWNYLKERGFPKPQRLVEEYNLHFCTEGLWRKRIIVPVTFEGKLVCWTGRAIYSTMTPRYLSLSHKEDEDDSNNPDKPLAPFSVKELVMNYDVVLSEQWRIVFVCEGPMDALKLDYYGKKFGARAVALFGTGVTETQKYLLADIKQHCQRLIVVPDQNAEANAMHLLRELSFLRTSIAHVPSGVEDPGALTGAQVREFIGSLLPT